jgi:hypothetical protein
MGSTVGKRPAFRISGKAIKGLTDKTPLQEINLLEIPGPFILPPP